MTHPRPLPPRLEQGRAQAAAALLVMAANDDAKADVLLAAGDHARCAGRRESAALTRALAAQVGGPPA